MDDRQVLDSIISSMRDGMVVVDTDKKILRCNDAAGSLLDIDPQCFLGESVHTLDEAIARKVLDVPSLIAAWRVANARINEKPRVEFEILSGATKRTIEATLFPIRAESERYGTVVLLRDVTAEREIAHLKDEFASMIAHEIKNPLTVIIGGLRTVLGAQDKLSAEEKELLITDAVTEAEATSELVANLLELTRAAANRLNLEKESVEITGLIKKVLRKTKMLHTRHRFIFRAGRRHLTFNGDRLRIERVVFNLLDNAAKYSPPGSKVEIFAGQEEREVIIAISDHGAGISPEDREKLFRPFERLDQSVTGTGIGLTVCKRLVEAHGGRIWIDSTPNVGSTFFFTLPAP
ncbi:MAG: PAS domain-containing protein [Chloroflexi bacterium]|nr:PAS domain-containing protein [Chloroflexota bacterium]